MVGLSFIASFNAAVFHLPQLRGERATAQPQQHAVRRRHQLAQAVRPRYGRAFRVFSVLAELLLQKVTNGTVFMDPVTDEIVPGYSAIIATPMCLTQRKPSHAANVQQALCLC